MLSGYAAHTVPFRDWFALGDANYLVLEPNHTDVRKSDGLIRDIEGHTALDVGGIRCLYCQCVVIVDRYLGSLEA